MKNVAIIGVGLIGGSLGQALRRVRRSGRRQYNVLGYGRDRSRLRLAKSMGALDAYSTDAREILPIADIIVFCVPVHKMESVAQRLRSSIKPGAIVTDVGSVKHGVVGMFSRVFSSFKKIEIVGGHPIAGSEKTGVRHSDARLFQGATCVLTPARTTRRGLREIEQLWKRVGARVVLMNSRQHDRALALTSHLPHLLSFALFSLVKEASRKTPLLASLAAGSFRDMTRVAASDADIWTGIVNMNRAELASTARSFQRILARLVSQSGSPLFRTLSEISRSKQRWPR